ILFERPSRSVRFRPIPEPSSAGTQHAGQCGPDHARKPTADSRNGATAHQCRATPGEQHRARRRGQLPFDELRAAIITFRDGLLVSDARILETPDTRNGAELPFPRRAKQHFGLRIGFVPLVVAIRAMAIDDSYGADGRLVGLWYAWKRGSGRPRLGGLLLLFLF